MSELERKRLAALYAYRVLDTEPEPTFDRITDLASDLFGAPIALVSLVDEERQWFKASTGLEARSTPRSQAFCGHALELEPHAVMVVEDAAADPRFAENPLVIGPPHIRFYAGAVLTDAEGYNLGTLCVIDTAPRPRPSDTDLDRLKTLAGMVVEALERRRGDRLISEQQRLLSMVESMSGVGHWRYAIKCGRVTWSDEVYRIHGVRRGEFEPGYDSWLGMFHQDDLPTLLAIVGDAIRDRSGYEFELRITRPDGEVREILAKATCEIDERGEVVALFGVIQDVTDQNQALRDVRHSEGRYKLLANHMADVVTRLRLDGTSDYISPAVQSLIGYTPAEMSGQPARAFVCEPDRPLLDATLATLAAGQPEATVQLRAQHRDGRRIWVETRLRLVQDEAGGPPEVVAVIRDIAYRKALEADLLAAREAAEAATQVKSQFLANMSHELRTPLTSIIGFTGLACAQEGLPDLARDYLQRIDSAGRALLCTVNDVLDFSKLEAGHVTLEPEPTDAGVLCRDTLQLFTPQAAAKDLRLTLDIAPELGPGGLQLQIDPIRVRQILLNLVGNAVKFTAAGGVALEVGYAAADQRLHVAVTDTGPGVAPEAMAKLFQRFSQVDGSITRSHGGTGLGLAICKGLVEAMGGRIGADSTPGRGCRFWFTLPAPPARVVAATPPPATGRPVAPLLFAGTRILVADDHPANRELARLFLAGCGAEVAEAEDGLVAAEIAALQPFDAILMDMRMPRLDGAEALELIRAGRGPNAATPIVAYTADASPDEAVRLKARGFDAVAAKPIEAAQLITAVAEAMAAGPAAASRQQRVAD